MEGITYLPIEIWRIIAIECEKPLIFFLVCKLFASFADDEAFWKQKNAISFKLFSIIAPEQSWKKQYQAEAEKAKQVLKRLAKELAWMAKDPPFNCAMEQIDNNPYHCKATVLGPDDSPYSGGVFFLDINFPRDYPWKAPTIMFTTEIFHINFKQNQRICIQNIAKYGWSPAISIDKLLVSIVSLLSNPSTTNCCVNETAKLYESDKEKYMQLAKEWTQRYAT